MSLNSGTFYGGFMFTNGRSGAAQERLTQEQQQQAQQSTSDTQRHLESQLEIKNVESQQQTIEGKNQVLLMAERVGASKQEVVNEARSNILGAAEYEISKLKPPPINADRRGEILDKVERAIEETATRILSKQEATLAQRAEAEKKVAEHERKTLVAEAEKQRSTLHSTIDLKLESFRAIRKHYLPLAG